MTVFFLSIGIFALFFILLSVRLLFIKNGEFRGTCASQSPWLNKEGVTIIQVTHSEKNAEYGTRIVNLLDGMVAHQTV